MKIIIPGELPGLNEIIRESKKHYGSYSTSKKKYTELCGWSALKKQSFDKKVNVILTWYTPNEKKDPDNIDCGIKFILDGFVEAGLIKGDSRKYIGDITHRHRTDRENPRVEVELEEVSV